MPEDDRHDSRRNKDQRFEPVPHDLFGCLFGIPLFIMLFYILQHFGVEATVLSAAALDVGAALLIGKLDLKAGIELMVITVFVYVGIRVAPLVANLLTSS